MLAIVLLLAQGATPILCNDIVSAMEMMLLMLPLLILLLLSSLRYGS
jgi:hypothetical protein